MTQQQTTTYQQQHALALPDGSAASQEADDQQQRSDCDQQVAHVQHLAELLRRVLNLAQQAEDGAAVHLHPDPHAQDGGARQLGGSEGEKWRTFSR